MRDTPGSGGDSKSLEAPRSFSPSTVTPMGEEPEAPKVPMKRMGSLRDTAEAQSHAIRSLRSTADAQFFFAMVGVALMMVQMELAWLWNTDVGYGRICRPNEDATCDDRSKAKLFPIIEGLTILNIIRGIISLSTLLLVITTVRHFVAKLDFMKAKNLYPDTTSMMSSRLRYPLLLELLLWIIHVFPGIEMISNDTPSAFMAFNFLMFLRLLLVGRVIRYRSTLNSSNGRFIGALTNVDFSTSFILKTALKDHPLKLLFGLLLTLMVVTGYVLKYMESIFCVTQADSITCQPLTFADAEWLLIVTILTVGYGDIVPSSDGGRFVAIMGGLVGTLVTALTFALATEYLRLSRAESKVVAFLKKGAMRKMIQLEAVRSIQIALRYHQLPKHWKSRRKDQELRLYEQLEYFRRIKRYVASNDPTDMTDKQLTILESLEVTVEELKGEVEAMWKFMKDEDDELHSEVHSVAEGEAKEAPKEVPMHAPIRRHGSSTSTLSDARSAMMSASRRRHSMGLPDRSRTLSGEDERGSKRGPDRELSPRSAAAPTSPRRHSSHHRSSILSRMRQNTHSEGTPVWVVALQASVADFKSRLDAMDTSLGVFQERMTDRIGTIDKRLTILESRVNILESSKVSDRPSSPSPGRSPTLMDSRTVDAAIEAGRRSSMRRARMSESKSPDGTPLVGSEDDLLSSAWGTPKGKGSPELVRKFTFTSEAGSTATPRRPASATWRLSADGTMARGSDGVAVSPARPRGPVTPGSGRRTSPRPQTAPLGGRKKTEGKIRLPQSPSPSTSDALFQE